ncbi:ABC transporter permease [Arthrobacter sp. Leaf69]|uniref:ABC transporter permease n=1 Tax=Arthrobacter sp. Leaf69 TaxID=1736232 RepID=UPI001F357EA9|nr:ABC transporter permease [Arthrobacter sp. Leaf69]
MDYLVTLWDYRHFVYYDSRARVMSGNSQDRLGGAWLLLTPLLNGAVYYLIFGILLGTGRGIENFISYLIIGLFLFQYSTRSISTSARSMISNRNVLQAFRFPRATLPIAVNVREALSSVPTLIVMLLLIILIPPVEVISVKWLFLILVVGLQSLFHLGISLIMARVVGFVPDVAHLLGFGLRAWLYFSAVFFSVDRFADNPWIMAMMNANPMFIVLDIARDCLIYDTWPSMVRWLTLCTWALASLSVGIVFFWRAEERYGRG